MAKDRTNMVSLLDIGLLTGTSGKLAEMGDGYTELTEDWGPNTESKQYVNMKSASNTVKGYALSMSPSRECLGDEMQTCIDTLFKKFPLLQILQNGHQERFRRLHPCSRYCMPFKHWWRWWRYPHIIYSD